MARWGIGGNKVFFTCVVCVIFYLQSPWTQATVEPLTTYPERLYKFLEGGRLRSDLTKQTGESVFWSCMQEYVSQFSKSQFPDLTFHQRTYLKNNYDRMQAEIMQSGSSTGFPQQGGRMKRQAMGNGYRIRKEIRMMTSSERQAYFAAVNALKRDRSLPPNVYDFLAGFHSTQQNLQRAHFGPNFASWHRVFLLYFEYLLRLKDPRVTVPYCATVMDNDLDEPIQTVLFSEQFFGNGQGTVTTGPFGGWPQITPNTVIRRNIGNGQLYSYEGVAAIMSRRRNSQIFLPTSEPDSNFENQHGSVHRWVGGTMNQLSESPNDPFFWCHHAYVDKIWEDFRYQQYFVHGINPQYDNPWIDGDPRFHPFHAPNLTMGLPDSQILNSFGYSNRISWVVRYEPLPTCTRSNLNCRSPYLRCNTAVNPPRCMARTVNEVPRTNYVNDRKQPGEARQKPCTSSVVIDSFEERVLENRYNQRTDWVHVPVTIITQRPPKLEKFEGYSLYGYSPRAGGRQQSSKQVLLQAGNQYSDPSCDKRKLSVGKAKIVTYGVNYFGTAVDFAVVDNRLGMYQATGFASVKNPESGGPSDALVAVFDSCGRACRPFFKGASSATRQQFTGAIRVSSKAPLQYGRDQAEAIFNTWALSETNTCPSYAQSDVALTFYCDYSSSWIWSSSQIRTSGGAQRPNPINITRPGSGMPSSTLGTSGNVPGARDIFGQTGRRPGSRGRGSRGRSRNRNRGSSSSRRDFSRWSSNQWGNPIPRTDPYLRSFRGG